MPITLKDGTTLKLGDCYKDVEHIAVIVELPDDWQISKEDGEKIRAFIMQFAPKDRKRQCGPCKDGDAPVVMEVK